MSDGAFASNLNRKLIVERQNLGPLQGLGKNRGEVAVGIEGNVNVAAIGILARERTRLVAKHQRDCAHLLAGRAAIKSAGHKTNAVPIVAQGGHHDRAVIATPPFAHAVLPIAEVCAVLGDEARMGKYRRHAHQGGIAERGIKLDDDAVVDRRVSRCPGDHLCAERMSKQGQAGQLRFWPSYFPT